MPPRNWQGPDATRFPDEVAALTGTQSPTQKDATLPDGGGRYLKIGTLRAAIKQLGIDWQKFQAS